MTMKRWNGSAFVDIGLAERWNGSAWVALSVAERWNGSAWVAIELPGGGGPGPGSPISVSIAPGSATYASSDFDPECPTKVTNSVTATPSGGTGPYTYSWTKVSGNSALQALVPDGPSTSWEASICFGTRSAVWRCTVTDSLGATGSATVSVNL